MKVLMTFVMLLSSAFASANPDWFVKCYERNNQEQELDLSWKIGVNRVLTLWQCDDKSPDCQQRAYLEREYDQGEVCLKSKNFNPGMEDSFNFELCHQRQENELDNPRRLVRVSIEAENQESYALCERSILKVLYPRPSEM